MTAGSSDLLDILGGELHDALVSGIPIAPISNRHPDLTIDHAYQIQGAMISRRLASGSRVIGKKIGATSEPVQKAVGIDQPDFGLLLDDSIYSSGEDISFSRLIQPRAEGEIAFFLKEDISGPNIRAEDVLDATGYVSPCIEIVDSRIRDWQINIIDTIADNASCGAVILGKDRMAPDLIDLAKCRMTLSVSGQERSSGIGSASLGHPAQAVAWLANKLSELGETLRKEEPILSGSLGQLIDIRRNDRLEMKIEGIGTCSTAFI